MSFQRQPRPASGQIDAPARSFGALPVCDDGLGAIVVPLPDGEALWIGLSARSRRLPVVASIAVETQAGTRIDAASGATLGAGDGPGRGFVVPPAGAVEGIARPGGGFWCFSRIAATPHVPAAIALEITATPARRVRPRPRPLDEAPLHSGSSAVGGGSTELKQAAPDSAEWDLDRRRFIRVELVAPAAFVARTGCAAPVPLDPAAGYDGWRLP